MVMTAKNKYVKVAHISEAKFREIIRLFSVDLDASQTTKLTGLSRTTINRYLKAIRLRLAQHCDAASPFSGEVEVDESFFGAKRVKGKRGRGAYGKTIVFGILQRSGTVHTEIVPNCSKATLQKAIRGKVELKSTIYSDGWRGYNGLVDVGYGKHLRVDHGRDEFARGLTHINGIEGFWGYAKTRLVRFRGMAPSTFYLHLKECEFRFNNRDNDIYRLMLKFFREQPLKLS
jgi:transposase-like protein